MPGTELLRLDGRYARGGLPSYVLLPDGTVRRPLDDEDMLWWDFWGRVCGWYQQGEDFLVQAGEEVRIHTGFIPTDMSIFGGIDFEATSKMTFADLFKGDLPVVPGYVPTVFETMVFGGPWDGLQKRYHTVEQARRGHRAVVRFVQARP